MRRIVITLIAALLTTSTHAHAGMLQQDDKRMHIAATNMAASVCDGYTHLQHIWSCAAFAFAVGVAKELNDKQHVGNRFDNSDLRADMVGSVLLIPVFYKEW